MSPAIECTSCSSKQQKMFNGELAVHFPGRDGLTKPIVWVFPKIAVCMDCGAAQFRVPARELQVLAGGTQVDEAEIDDAA